MVKRGRFLMGSPFNLTVAKLKDSSGSLIEFVVSASPPWVLQELIKIKLINKRIGKSRRKNQETGLSRVKIFK